MTRTPIRTGSFLSTLVLVILGGCDPCDGVVSCREDAEFRVTGQIVDHATGEPAHGVEVQFTWQVGTEVERPTTTALTDGEGRYSVAIPARSEGPALFGVRVTPPGDAPGYDPDPVMLRASRTRGEGIDLGRWTSSLHLPVLVTLRRAYRWEEGCMARLTQETRVGFRRTGGVPITNEEGAGVRMDTDRFVLDARPEERGVVEGDVIVSNPGASPIVHQGVRVRAEYEEGPRAAVFVTLRPYMNYSGEVFWNELGGEPIHPGTVEFRRTGGIEVCPDRFRSEVQPWGGFSLVMATVQEGEVVGELIIHPEGFPSDTLRDVRIPTNENPGFILFSRWWFPKP